MGEGFGMVVQEGEGLEAKEEMGGGLAGESTSDPQQYKIPLIILG